MVRALLTLRAEDRAVDGNDPNKPGPRRGRPKAVGPGGRAQAREATPQAPPEPAPPSLEEQFAGFESVPIATRVRVGAATCRLGRLSEMKPGEVIALDREVGEPFDLMSDNRLLALVEPVADDEAVTLKVVELVEDVDDGVDGC